MSLDGNRKDFENALKELETTLSNIHHEISASDYDVIESVISEYNGHYIKDIDDVIDKLSNVEDSLENTEIEVQELQAQIYSMDTKIDQLEYEVENLNKNTE